ncbi:peptidase inhibitor family I36 protein [Streptomyces noursei]|uniref:peptidase inhibitor family I36 protein n=1 Tax=Streptomyces noursei TaxID=1971 RepID=UPI001963FCD6|nr:peptidase inhibitor family I36 protein [Streptomyces noursei]QRX92129.1 peptidase inhibitor family I36 protein [Streptomyces noursei]
MPVLRKFVVAAAVLAGTVISAYPASAQPLASSSSHSSTGHARLTGGSWTAYSEKDWSGPNTTFSGDVGDCHYVGDNWNDKIRSARANGANVKVELWDNYDCTGGSITIDGSGYHEIGAWVSAYRVTAA